MKTHFLSLCIVPGIVTCDRTPLFYAFGDFGENSTSMKTVISQLHAQPQAPVVFLLGDLFYPRGVKSVTDPQFKLFDSFSDISERFIVMAGNHDYGYSESVPALMEYSRIEPKWIFPARYYMKRVDLANGNGICAFVLDTHVFEKPQLNWLETNLQTCMQLNMFRIIFTHYPVLTSGIYAKSKNVAKIRNKLVPLIEKYGVHAYISGHEHSSQVFEQKGVQYIISGATAQMNRKKAFEASYWKEARRFFNDREAAITAFYLDSDDPNSIPYSFIRASDGKSLFSSKISLKSSSLTTARPVLTTSPPVVPTATEPTYEPSTQPYLGPRGPTDDQDLDDEDDLLPASTTKSPVNADFSTTVGPIIFDFSIEKKPQPRQEANSVKSSMKSVPGWLIVELVTLYAMVF
jgi:tartrate-resistant acid phosphatase type 5